MKPFRLLFISIIVLLPTLFSCGGKTAKSIAADELSVVDSLATFEINEEIHNFGTLMAGENVSFSFVVKNTGTGSLMIKGVESDCGCISLKYDRAPVGPGKSTIIEVGFDSSGLFGRQYKPIAVEINSVEKIKYLAVVAEVKNDMIEINN